MSQLPLNFKKNLKHQKFQMITRTEKNIVTLELVVIREFDMWKI